MRNRFLAFTSLIFLLSGCALNPRLTDQHPPASSFATKLPPMPGGLKIAQEHIDKGIEFLHTGDYQRASLEFNAAVRIDGHVALAHFWNGFAYHLRALEGDTTRFEYAEVGYRVALQIDPGFKLAALMLGKLCMQLKRYRDSQDQYARGLLINSFDPDLLTGMAESSYLARDLKTAFAAVKQAEMLIPNDPKILRIGTLVNAALNRHDVAKAYLKKYKRVVADRRIIAKVASNMYRWDGFYKQNGKFVIESAIKQQEQKQVEADKLKEEVQGKETEEGVEADHTRQMALIEATIIRSQSKDSSAGGINLLQTLNLIIGTQDAETAFSPLKRIIDDGNGAAVSEVFKGRNNKAILPNIGNLFKTSNISLNGLLSYSINVGNSETGRLDIISRPTLTAMDKIKSTYESGSDVKYVVTGAGGGDPSDVDQDVGLKLEVTPDMIDDDTISLSISVTNRAFDTAKNNIPSSVTGAIVTGTETVKDIVTTNVALKYGETLILSGLTDRQSSQTNNGVDFLKNVPFVGNFFGTKSSEQTHRSTIILVTPHRADIARTDRTGQVRKHTYQSEQLGTENIQNLLARFKDKYKLPPLMDAKLVKAFMLPQFVRDFRLQDIKDTVEAPDKYIKFVINQLS